MHLQASHKMKLEQELVYEMVKQEGDLAARVVHGVKMRFTLTKKIYHITRRGHYFHSHRRNLFTY